MSSETIYTCDVCGKRIDTHEELGGAIHIVVKPLIIRSLLNADYDLCASCAEKIKELLPGYMYKDITPKSLEATKTLFSKEEN